jgi:hypothetical protein
MSKETNGESSINVSRAMAFRVILLVLQTALTVGIFWVRAEIHKELKEYVSHNEFEVYKSDHEKFIREVVARLQGSVDDMKHQMDRLEAKIDRVTEKRSASVEPMPNKAVASFD